MSLRLRLILAVLLTAVPILLVLSWDLVENDRAAREQGLRDFVRFRMNTGDRERCEASPETFGGQPQRPRPRQGPGPGQGRRPRPGQRPRPMERPAERPGPAPDRPGPELWAYDRDLVSANPDAPAIPEALAAELRAGAPRASGFGATHFEAAFRMDWDDGPCAVILARTRLQNRAPPLLDTRMFLVLGVALAAVLLALGPPLRRLRRLEAEVRRSADDQYRSPIPARGGDEVAAIAHSFNAARAQIREHIDHIEEREQALRAFIGDTTHDVMLPLTVLQGHLTALRSQAKEGRTSDREVLRAAIEETQYVASLLHNLGAVAKLELEAPDLRHDPVDWNELVERVVDRHRILARERGVQLDFAVPEDPIQADGDVTLLEQAVGNVVQNGIRYNRTGGHVAVVLERRGAGFCLRVADDGPGIPAAELERLPERRFRGREARSRHPEGSGLGLHIARDVAERHGMDFAIGPAEGGGLEVLFTAPAPGPQADQKIRT